MSDGPRQRRRPSQERGAASGGASSPGRAGSDEREPLLARTRAGRGAAPSPSSVYDDATSLRAQAHAFLDGRTGAGRAFEAVLIHLIMVNVVCFVLSTDAGIQASAGDFFNVVEVCTTFVFTAEYLMRFWSIAEERSRKTGQLLYPGPLGRFKWAFTNFFSWVDLASILPYYADLLLPQDIPATQFIRLLRLFRMMRADRYMEAFTTFDDILVQNKKLLATGGFVGFTVWIILSSFYYLGELCGEVRCRAVRWSCVFRCDQTAHT